MATRFSNSSTPTLAIFFVFSILCLLPTSLSQPSICNGIVITYRYVTGSEISPILVPDDPANQPYRFVSTLTVRNNGPHELKNWRVFVGFRHGELLVSAANAVLADGASLPANVSGGAVLAGSPVADLKTAIETAGNDDQMQAVVELLGTQFGVGGTRVPLPDNVTLANDGYLCPPSATRGNETSVCCIPDANSRSSINIEGDFSPLQTGDITIMYDVTMTYDRNYWAQVTISNHNPFGRLQNWNLTWDWMEGEFINAMRGAYPKTVDTGDCIFGRQGQFYQGFDFSRALSCETSPTIIDLPLERTNDTNLGLLPFCCRAGSILPPSMDPTRSKSSFQMEVYKMPPSLNKTHLTPPQNWKINSTVGPDYKCGPPIRVAPSLFPDRSGLPSNTSAVASWQVACNISITESYRPKCCVSFSSFFNDSIVPCNTCACGCDGDDPRNADDVCSSTEPSLLLPSQALPIPFENRTKLIREFADIKRRQIPNPMPCPDNCGVSINWHLLSDFKDGWTARITLFNWAEADVADWFAAVELDNAMPGFEEVYSIDGKALPGDNNNTLFLQGIPGLNYLIAERNGSNPKKDPRVPGMQQSVISFTKKKLPGRINVARGDGFPTRVHFNGEECSIPTMLPSSAHRMAAAFSALFGGMVSLLLFLIVMHQ